MNPANSRWSLRATASSGLARRLTVAAALATVVLGVSACSSSTTTGTTTTTASQTGSTPTTGASGSTTPTTGATPTTGSASASLTQIESKLSSSQTATFVAGYSVSSTESGVSNKTTFTVAHAGSDSLVAIAESKGSFEEFEVGKTDTVCSKPAATWTCYSGSFAAEIGASLSIFVKDFGAKAAIAELAAASGGTISSSTVDGQAVTCASFKTSSGSYKVCVTSQGVMAEVVGQNTQGTFTLTLTSLSSSVPSNEFTPPAKATSIP